MKANEVFSIIYSKGGNIYLENGVLKIALPKENNSNQLRQLISQNKRKVQHYIQMDEKMDEAFKKEKNKVLSTYKQANCATTIGDNPEIIRSFHEIEDRLENCWKACRDGEQNFEDFLSTLKDWVGLYISRINASKRKDG